MNIKKKDSMGSSQRAAALEEIHKNNLLLALNVLLPVTL